MRTSPKKFDTNFLEPDSKIDEVREVRAAIGKHMKNVLAAAEEPGVVADVVLEAANAPDRNSDMRPVLSRAACDCCADSRLPA